MKIIIAGGRDFRDYQYLVSCIESLNWQAISEVVSGKQASWDKEKKVWYGADYLGEQWAKSRGIPVKLFPADWDNLGKPAGPIRNGQMAEYGDGLISFWNGISTGTLDMITKMENLGKPREIFKYPPAK